MLLQHRPAGQPNTGESRPDAGRRVGGSRVAGPESDMDRAARAGSVTESASRTITISCPRPKTRSS